MATQALATGHVEFVHDVSYDYYGKRIATCSSDKRIKVWGQLPGGSGDWHCQADWEAHHGSVWRVDWAHPEFGCLLASAGSDRSVHVWEEAEAVDDKGRVVARWSRRGMIVDARASVNDVKFGPRMMGLVLAAGSADGTVRIYEATDTTNLVSWHLRDALLAADGEAGGVTALSWNHSPYDSDMLVVATATAVVAVWGYSKSAKKWIAMMELHGHAGPVLDVSWAPNIGRTYHLIATASRDGVLSMWRLQADTAPPGWASPLATHASGAPGWAVRRLADSVVDGVHVSALTEHASPVWRVAWNVTGTVLASTGDDGKLRVWRSNMSGKWACVSAVDSATLDAAGAGDVAMNAHAPAGSAASGSPTMTAVNASFGVRSMPSMFAPSLPASAAAAGAPADALSVMRGLLPGTALPSTIASRAF